VDWGCIELRGSRDLAFRECRISGEGTAGKVEDALL